MEAVVFALVASTFLTIYITQPVLPILGREFGVSPAVASLTVSAVVLGIALANLPFGVLADRFPIRPLVVGGGALVALASVTCALTHSIRVLIGARFLQGLFVPSMSTCLAAYLSRTLPPPRLNVMMGWYVSAAVAGGMGGRLLGGFAFPPDRWRLAFLAAAALVGCAIALTFIPSLPAIALSLAVMCAGFFTVHAAAVGSLNARLSGSRGRANSLYVLLYYLGGAAGITAAGAAYARWGWRGAALVGLAALLVPFSVGAVEAAQRKD